MIKILFKEDLFILFIFFKILFMTHVLSHNRLWCVVMLSFRLQCFLVIFILPLSVLHISIRNRGLPRWLSGKEPACSAEDASSICGSRISPREGNGNPLHPVFLTGKSHGQRSLAGCQRVSESDTCDWTQHIVPLAVTVWKRISILQMSQLIKQNIFLKIENHMAVEDTWLWQFCV